MLQKKMYSAKIIFMIAILVFLEFIKTLIGVAFPKPVDNTICSCNESVIYNNCKMLLNEKNFTDNTKLKSRKTSVPVLTDNITMSSEVTTENDIQFKIDSHPPSTFQSHSQLKNI